MVWHEDEAFWELIQEFVFPPEKIEEATEQVEQLLALLDLDGGRRCWTSPAGWAGTPWNSRAGDSG